MSIWRKKRSYFIVKCQANLRRRIYSGKSINDRFLENHAATIIQSLVRVYIAKNTLINLRRIRASDIITRTVKNYFQRIQTDHNAMENAALRIQRSVKRQIAKKQFKLLKDVITHATITIQCNWRGYSHRQIKNEFMQLRIVEHQKDQIRLLLTERDYSRGIFRSFKEKLNQNDEPTEGKKRQQCIHEKSLITKIYDDEMNSIELQKLAIRISPRSVSQGWKEQTEKNIAETRNRLTKLKLEYMFEYEKKSRKSESDIEKSLANYNDHNNRVAEINKMVDIHLEQLWKINHLKRHHGQDRRRRQNIADEKRKWAMSFYSPSGKPFKLNTRCIRGTTGSTLNDGLTQTNPSTEFLVKNSPAGDMKSYEKLSNLIESINLRNRQINFQQYMSFLQPINKGFTKW